jgi:predicted AlkP superfamily pyrophosphatase or phosphodiesterase
MPSIFSSLGLITAHDSIGCGESPIGREILFLVDGLGLDVLSEYADTAPTLSAMKAHGSITTSFPSTTATSLATLTDGPDARCPRNDGLYRASPSKWRPHTQHS